MEKMVMSVLFVVAAVGSFICFIVLCKTKDRYIMKKVTVWGILLLLCAYFWDVNSEEIVETEAVVTDKSRDSEIRENFGGGIKIYNYYLNLDFDIYDDGIKVSKSIYDEVKVGDTVNVEMKVGLFNHIMEIKEVSVDRACEH